MEVEVEEEVECVEEEWPMAVVAVVGWKCHAIHTTSAATGYSGSNSKA